MFGVLNIYKPKGMTSHDVVGRLRKITGVRQIGHTGTLDPFAEGVLPVCVSKATRLIEYFSDDKEYIATVQFGANTDTYDLEGEITEKFDKKITRDELIQILPEFQGEISQYPPKYSAIKVNGKKLYEYARKGEDVEIKPRNVNIYKIELIDFDYDNQWAKILVSCSKGTYIRSLAYDIGAKLSVGAYLTGLVRTMAGKFRVENSLKLDNLDNIEVEKNFINPLEIIDLPKLELDDRQHEKILHGQAIENLYKYSDFVILVYNNKINAIGFAQNNEILVKKVFDL